MYHFECITHTVSLMLEAHTENRLEFSYKLCVLLLGRGG